MISAKYAPEYIVKLIKEDERPFEVDGITYTLKGVIETAKAKVEPYRSLPMAKGAWVQVSLSEAERTADFHGDEFTFHVLVTSSESMDHAKNLAFEIRDGIDHRWNETINPPTGRNTPMHFAKIIPGPMGMATKVEAGLYRYLVTFNAVI